MNLIKRWNAYMGPQDERLASESCKYMKIGYFILLAGAVICLYYSIMVDQVSTTTDTALYTPVGENVFPVTWLMIIVVLLSSVIPMGMQMRAGIISDRKRYASTDRIPWDFVIMLSLVTGLILGVLTCGLRMVAEIQIVGIEAVTWAGDIAMGVVFFVMGFGLAIVFTAAMFNSAIKNRRRLEAELDDEEVA